MNNQCNSLVLTNTIQRKRKNGYQEFQKLDGREAENRLPCSLVKSVIEEVSSRKL